MSAPANRGGNVAEKNGLRKERHKSHTASSRLYFLIFTPFWRPSSPRSGTGVFQMKWIASVLATK